jgi:citrate lyase subunit beta/citryl-CoA lyase
MIARAAASAADLVFLDLEDSVAASEKPSARRNITRAFRELDWGRKTRAVRINGLRTEYGRGDVEWLVGEAGDAVDCLVVPKIEHADDVLELDALLTDLEQRQGVSDPIGLEVLIESVRAFIAVEEIAAASPRIETVIFGHGDLSAEQGMRLETVGGRGDYSGGDLWYYPRMKIIMAARAAGIEAVDGPFAAFIDTEGYRVEAQRAALMGACGKWAIHPSQVEIANEVFSPTAEELERARHLTAAYREAEEQGVGAIQVGGEMVDAATIRILARVLNLADAIETRAGNAQLSVSQ